ncbi:MAG TPA: hypothetical protein PLA68_06060 [Panacibacter sp.]|nr:hypothetical protein [Panacibacter sp.]
MKKICFFINLLLITGFAAAAQLRNDTASTAKKNLPDSIKYFPLSIVPSNYYSSKLGFFCKKELQLQKLAKFPVKFRLGTVEYCDKMEGKNAQNP